MLITLEKKNVSPQSLGVYMRLAGEGNDFGLAEKIKNRREQIIILKKRMIMAAAATAASCPVKPLNLLIRSSIPALPFVHNTKYIILRSSTSSSVMMMNKHPLKCFAKLMGTSESDSPNSLIQHLVVSSLLFVFFFLY